MVAPGTGTMGVPDVGAGGGGAGPRSFLPLVRPAYVQYIYSLYIYHANEYKPSGLI